MTTSLFSLPSPKLYLFAVLVGLGFGLVLFVQPQWGFLCMTAGIGVVLAERRPVLLAYLVIAGIAFFSGMTRGKLIPLLVPHEAILVGVAILLAPLILPRLRASGAPDVLLRGLLLVYALGLTIYPVVEYLVRGVSLTPNEIMRLVAPLQFVLLFAVFRYFFSEVAERTRLLRWILICGAGIAFIGLLQQARIGFVVRLLHTWYPSSHEAAALRAARITSVMAVWNGLGTLMMLLILMLRCLMIVKPPVMSRRTIILLMGICAACLFATTSFASLIGLVLGLLIIEAFDRRAKGTVIFIFLGLALVGFLLRENILHRFSFQFGQAGLVPQSLGYRFKVWREVFLPLLRAHWLWGFRPVMPSWLAWEFPESQYLNLILRSGIFSLLAHVSWVALALVWIRRRIRSSDAQVSAMAIFLFALFVVLSIMGFSNEVFSYSVVAHYLWLTLAFISVEGTPA